MKNRALVQIYWNIAPVLPFLFVALLGAGILWKEMDVIGFKENAWMLGSLSALIIMLIPLQAILPSDFSSFWYRREVARNRAKLASEGLTPEAYLASIPENDWKQRAEVKVMLGVN